VAASNPPKTTSAGVRAVAAARAPTSLFLWGGGGQVGESNGGDQSDSDAYQNGGADQSGDAGDEHRRTACGGLH
jgi:hypothetical protein